MSTKAIETVHCPACGNDTFEMRLVDEHGEDGDSTVVFCADCGNATGKMAAGTLDRRLTEGEA